MANVFSTVKRNLKGTDISHQVSEVYKSHRTQKGRWYSRDGHFCNGKHVNEYFVIIAQEHKQNQTSSISFDSSKLEEFVSSTVDNFVTQFNIPIIIVQEKGELY